MKLLRHGFAFVIAILTISLTIAAQAGAFKAEGKKVQADCFQTTDMGSLVLQASGCPSSTLCIPANQYSLYRAINPLQQDIVCDPVTNPPFCCAKVSTLNGCGFQITQVLCGIATPIE